MKKLYVKLCVGLLLLVIIADPVIADAAVTAADEMSVVNMEERDAGQASSLGSAVGDTSIEETIPTQEPVSTQEPVPTQEPIQVQELNVWFGSANYNNKTVTLEWDGDNSVSYVILHRAAKGWKEVYRTGNTKKAIKIEDYGEKNVYKVQAYNAEGQLIKESGKIQAVFPVQAGKLQTTSVSASKVKLVWAKSKGATFYQIFQKKGKGKYYFVKKTKKTNVNLSVQAGADYSFKVVPVYRASAGNIKSKAGKIDFSNKEIVSMGHQKYSYSEMCGDIQSLCKKYSGYVSYDVIGYSEKGRAIYDVVLGNPSAKKSILVVGTLHAREYVVTVLCMKQLEYYLQNYNKTVDGKKLSNIFSKCNVHYVAMANPDGVVISQNGRPGWKGNANGVNLNRNFPYSFKKEGSISGNTYSGSSAASEQETQAVIRLTKKLKKTQYVGVVNYHAMGQIIFGDYSGRNSKLRSDISNMYRIAKGATGYSSAASSGYSATSNGNYREYLSHVVKIPSVTIEVGSGACPVSQWQYASVFQRNKLVVLREAAWLSRK